MNNYVNDLVDYVLAMIGMMLLITGIMMLISIPAAWILVIDGTSLWIVARYG